MGYIEEQYELYKENRDAVDPSLIELFDKHGAPDRTKFSKGSSLPASEEVSSVGDIKKLTSAMRLVEAIRRFGHLEADIYPVGRVNRETKLVDPDPYGLSE